MLKSMLDRLRAMIGWQDIERDVDDELLAHIEKETEKNIQEGMHAEKARQEALRTFGGFVQTKEKIRDVRRGPWIDSLLQDLRYALHSLARLPGYTTIILLTLALGISANATIFSFVDYILFRPVTDNRPEQIVGLYKSDNNGNPYQEFSYPDYQDLKSRMTMFSDLIAYTPDYVLRMVYDNQVIQGGAELVTANYFSGLGQMPRPGRGFRPEDNESSSAEPVVVISHRVWARDLASDPEIVGRTVLLNGHSFTIIGVAPEGFTGVRRPVYVDFWVPLMMRNQIIGHRADHMDRKRAAFYVLGRLNPENTIQEARASMTSLGAQMAEAYPDSWLDRRGEPKYISIEQGALNPEMRDVFRFFFTILLLLILIVLLIVCSNVSGLVLARNLDRQQEISIRLALGAGRWRIIRQLLTESMVLALIAGSVSLLLTWWFKELIQSWEMPVLVRAVGFQISIDFRIFAYTMAISFVTATFFGLIPAWEMSKTDLYSALKTGVQAVGRYGRASRSRRMLVVIQIAFSFLLLTLAGLFEDSLEQTYASDLGFKSSEVLVANIDLQDAGYNSEQATAFFNHTQNEILAIPGVTTVSYTKKIPTFIEDLRRPLSFPGYKPESETDSQIRYNMIGPAFFETLSIPLLRGRDFTDLDKEGAPLVAIINEEFRARYWSERNPVGEIIDLGEGAFATVVGVVGNMATADDPSPKWTPQPFLFLPALQNIEILNDPAQNVDLSGLSILVRTSGDPLQFAHPVQSKILDITGNLPASRVTSLDAVIQNRYLGEQIIEGLLVYVSVFALVLTAIGLYGAIAFMVRRRTHEIGVRMAVGAQFRDIWKLILRHTLSLSVTGLVIGLGLTIPVTRILASRPQMIGVEFSDPTAFAEVIALLIAVALMASYIPVRRAFRVDPVQTLREE